MNVDINSRGGAWVMVLLKKSNGSKSMIPIDHAVLARVGIFDGQPFVGEV